ncbi:MAG: tetratricopeptide repeat protein [Wenyingzhuangia sp.]|jgi:predicted negative regulator of RcsB-dependent stress response|uniref:tetratricopeptide repeat protein n=1 Tax=Wenyingzhuangia sp. TaxID=1964193 RepID=UPI00321B7746
MATYQKRGYKKTNETDEEIIVDNTGNTEHSTTAEVFNTLEESANKSEKWIEKNSKPLLISLIVSVVAIFGYMGYTQFVVAPREKEAADALFFAKKSFVEANNSSNETLYTTALEGAEGNFGLADIAKNYGNTEAGNLAKYYAGISHVNLKNYDLAIEFLEDVSTKDNVLNAIVAGNIGDAHLAKNNSQEALSYFTKAGENTQNNAIAPLYLMKAGKVALTLKNFNKAQDLFENVKENFPKSTQAKNIDLYINQAKYAN